MLIWEDEKQILISSVEGERKGYMDKEGPLIIIFKKGIFLLEAFFYSPFLKVSPIET